MVSVETSDTIKVVDVIVGWPDVDLTLVEQWNPVHLKLIDWSVEPSSGSVADRHGQSQHDYTRRQPGLHHHQVVSC